MADFKNRVVDITEIDVNKSILPRNFDCLRTMIKTYEQSMNSKMEEYEL